MPHSRFLFSRALHLLNIHRSITHHSIEHFIKSLSEAGLCRKYYSLLHRSSKKVSNSGLNLLNQPDSFLTIKHSHTLRQSNSSSFTLKHSKRNVAGTAPTVSVGNKAEKKTEKLRIFRPIIRVAELEDLPREFVGSLQELEVLTEFRRALDWNTPSTELFEHYRKLPGQRLSYLSRGELEVFVTRMMTVPLREQTLVLQYLTVLDDMKACKIPIRANEMNAAISFATSACKYTTTTEVQMAFRMFAEFEKENHLVANTTTFNILLQVAVDAGSTEAVDELLREMNQRSVKFDRFTYTTLITYFGTRRDSSGVSNTYKIMIDGGEIVDTVVLNALMTAFLRCEELPPVQRIYAFMKQSDKKLSGKLHSDRNWRILRLEAQEFKNWARTPGNQKKAGQGPDEATFGLLLQYYCKRGNWQGAQSILTDMSVFGVSVSKSTYLALLKAFSIHGKWMEESNPWSKQRLEKLLGEVIDAGIDWDKHLVIWVLNSVANVYDDKDILQIVWDEIVKQIKARGGKMHPTADQVFQEVSYRVGSEQNLP